MTYTDSNPADSCSAEDRKRMSRRRPNMYAKILTFASHADTALLEYDPATVDPEEINRVIAEYEANSCIGGDQWPTSLPNLASEQRIPHV